MARDGDTGTVAVHDVVRLPHGRLLLALGELGMRLVGPDGRALTRWAAPTHHLVANPPATRVIAVARRGSVVRLARLDSVTRALRPWGDAEIRCFAASYDGGTWFASDGERLLALYSLSASVTASWSASWEPGRVESVWAAGPAVYAVIRTGSDAETVRYDLQGPLLRERTPGAAGNPDLARAWWSVGPISAREVAGSGETSIHVLVGEALVARFVFQGATRAGVRLDPGDHSVVAWYDLGRVQVFDLEERALRTSLRC